MTKTDLIQRFFGSHLRSRASIFLLAIITASLLTHSFDSMTPSPIQNLYQKIERLDLEPEQRKALRAVRNLLIEEQALADHPVNRDQVLLSIAGILTEKQFHDFSGKAKDARQKLRYELRQIRAEMALHGEEHFLSRR